MFKCFRMKDAIAHAKERLKQAVDVEINSHDLVFKPFAGCVDVRCGDEEWRLSPQAESQAAKMFSIPPAWIKVKETMEDLDHLCECFNRHVKAAENKVLQLRLWNTPEGEQFIRAIWPSNTANMDILPTLRILAEEVKPHISRWAMIHITGHTLRVYGHLKKKSTGPTQTGVYACTSEDGSFGIRTALGLGLSANPKLFSICDFDRRYYDAFKRRENQEGDLQIRFRKSLHNLVECAPSFWGNARQFRKEMFQVQIGSNIAAFLELSRKSLNYPTKMDNILMGCWKPDTHLVGFWEALMTAGYSEGLHEHPDLAHKLQRAAGILLSHGCHGLARALAETSKEIEHAETQEAVSAPA